MAAPATKAPATPPKKVDPHAPPPNHKIFLAAAVLLTLGFGWFVYQLNPGGALRSETPEEKKERIEHENEIKMKEREELARKKQLEMRMRRAH